jgi:hypothetical protein
MRAALALWLVLLLLASSTVSAGAAASHNGPATANAPPMRGPGSRNSPLALGEATALPLPPAISRDPGVLPSSFFNTTLLSHGDRPTGASLPIAVVGSEPAPSVPPTVPSLIQFPVNISSGASRENFQAPAGGPWARIILNFTGTVVPDVYDSSYRMYIDNVLVMFGTTPEYGTWTVLRDLTEYSALFHGNVSLYFQLSAADITGHFLENVSLSFYPLLPGEAPPSVPNSIVSLWSTPYVHSATPVVWADQTIPTNVTNATFELWTYGFGPQDEFWYLQSPNYRGLQVSIDGSRVLTLLPYEYINTGGIDLFLWRPVTAVMTSNDRPVDFDATPMLGLFEGTHNFSVEMEGITSPGDTWLVGGALLMNTSAGTGPATTTAFDYSGETVHNAGLDEQVNYSYSYGSKISTASGEEWANETVDGLFSSNMTEVGAWQNLSMNERMASNASLHWGTHDDQTVQVVSFPFSADLSGTFVLTGTTGGGYPEFGNFTTELLNVDQDWSETSTQSDRTGSLPPVVITVDIALRLQGATGVYGGTEELTSPGVPVITGFTSDIASTPKSVAFQEYAAGTDGSYQHTIVGTAYNPPGPYNVESIESNIVTASVSAAVLLSSAAVSLGGSLTLTSVATGGAGWLNYGWSDLPPGCAPNNAATVSCRPMSPGTYYPSVTVTDTLGDSDTAVSSSLTVRSSVQAQITGAPNASDDGVILSLAASVTGGASPYSCAWSVDGTLIAIQACGLPFPYVMNGTTPLTFSVVANDTTGALSPVASAIVTANPPPSISIQAPSGTGTTGTAEQFRATVLGGSGPFTYLWEVDGVATTQNSGSEDNYTFTAAGSYQVTVSVTDAAGLVANAAPVTVVVSGSSSTHAASSSSSPNTWEYVGIAGWLAAAAVVVVLLFSRTKARPPRPPPRAAYSERPRAGPP